MALFGVGCAYLRTLSGVQHLLYHVVLTVSEVICCYTAMPTLAPAALTIAIMKY